MKGAAAAALPLLERSRAAAARLRQQESSSDDLHEFRVALRRLRVHLKAHGKACGADKKTRRRLGRIFRSTGPLRDAQVELRWLAEHGRRASGQGVDAAALLAAAGRRREAMSVDRTLMSEFERLARRLRGALKAAGPAAYDEKRFRRKAAKKAGRSMRKLAKRLSRLGEDPPMKALHKARVAAKRLRYLIEPLDEIAGLPKLSSVKKLQTLLGDIHDLQVIEADLDVLRRQEPSVGALAARAASEARRERSALIAAARKEWRRPLLKNA